MTDPKLVRIKRTQKDGIIQDCDVYIGRRWTYGGWDLPKSKWANPFPVKKVGSVEKACEMYLSYIVHSDVFHDLPELESKTLGCFCEAPAYLKKGKIGVNNKIGFYCHGCVLIQLFKIVKYHNFNTKKVQRILKIMY